MDVLFHNLALTENWVVVISIKWLSYDTMPLSYISISVAKYVQKKRGQVEKERRNNMEKCDFSIIAIRNSGEKKTRTQRFFHFLKSIHFWNSVFHLMKTRYFSWCHQGLVGKVWWSFKNEWISKLHMFEMVGHLSEKKIL